LEVTVRIESCHTCRHIDHSGAFTLGGAKLICGHRDAAKMVQEAKGLRDCGREVLKLFNSPDKKKRAEGDIMFRKTGSYWGNRILPHNGDKIPDWCPLKHGSRY